RFPVARGEIDDVQGILHAKDLLAQAPEFALDLPAAIRTPLVVPESLPVLRLLEEFKNSDLRMAVVVDEHGTFEGDLTPTDILIEIAGNLPEIAQDREPDVIRRDDGSLLIDGRASVSDVERMMDADDIQRRPFSTIAGFVRTRLGHLPAPGESFEWNGRRFEVADMDGHRIDKVIVTDVESPGTQT